MKVLKLLAVSFIAFSLGGVAQAQTNLKVTGSTAFRKAFTLAVEHLMGTFDCTFIGTSGANNPETGATYVVLKGNISGASNPVTVQMTWAGSVGGTTSITGSGANVSTLGTLGFLNDTNLTGASYTYGDTTTTITATSSTATSSNCTDAKADVAMSDSLASSAGLSGLTSAISGGSPSAQTVGAVIFEWVANNGATIVATFTGDTTSGSNIITNVPSTTGLAVGQTVGGPNLTRNSTISAITGSSAPFTVTLAPASGVANANATKSATASSFVTATLASNPITNISSITARKALGGSSVVAQFTGSTTDTTPVYVMGRNFDSGTRLSELAETAIGVFGGVQQLQPTFNATGADWTTVSQSNRGKGGGANHVMTNLDYWAAETVISKSFAQGQSGFNSGGDLADALAGTGSDNSSSTNGVAYTTAGSAPILATAGNGGAACWLIGYLGRSDAERACQTAAGPNTAHRLTWNGVADWNEPIGPDGKPASYNDDAIRQGLYTAWEYEFMYYNSSNIAAASKTAAGLIAADLKATTAATSGVGVLISTMQAKKTIEGGVVTHN